MMLERLFGGYSLSGFVRAVLIFAVLMLPNILYFVLPKMNETQWQPHTATVFTFFETYLRIAYFAVLFVVTPTHEVRKSPVTLIVAIVGIVLYYVCWAIYFSHQMDAVYLLKPFLGIPVPLAIFPVIFLVFIALWMNSYLLAGCGLLFGIGHIVNSYSVYLQVCK